MKRETIKNTTSSRNYKILYKLWLEKKSGLCHICAPHEGCNSNNKKHPIKNWKKFRKTKWK